MGTFVYLSCLLPELWPLKCGSVCKYDSFMVFPVDGSKKPVIVLAKYLSASERSH